MLNEELLNKIINNLFLTNYEKKIIEKTFSNFILNCSNLDHDLNNLIHIYSLNYLAIADSPSINKIIILCYDLLNELNKKYNKKFNINFINKKFSKLHAFVKINQLPHAINLNVFTFFRDYKLTKLLPHLSINKVSFFLVYTILHEFNHCLQNEYILSHDNDITDNYFIEYVVMMCDRDFYNKKHQFFIMEQESDIFATSQVLDYYRMYFKSDSEFENEMVNKYYSVYISPYLDREEFISELDVIYNEIKEVLPEFISDNKEWINNNKQKKLH